MGAAQSVATFRLSEQGESTLLQFSYQAIGHVPEEEVAVYTSGWTDLVTVRLKSFVESGHVSGFGARE